MVTAKSPAGGGAQGFWKPQACLFQDLEAMGYPITFQQIPHLLQVENPGDPEGILRATWGGVTGLALGKEDYIRQKGLEE